MSALCRTPPADPTAPQHVPVLHEQVMLWLSPARSATYIDATVGLGGHARGILERSSPDGRLLALDADPEALGTARERLSEFASRTVFVCARHTELSAIARSSGFRHVDGVLLDLGLSSLQLDDPRRGFSFQSSGPLDMRMGPDAKLTAGQIVNTWREEEIAGIIHRYGEERYSRRIARAICAARPLQDTLELASTVSKAVGRRQRIHPATRTFQALRIAVNDELGSLESVLPQAVDLLVPGGRLAVIAFHSLEDRIVKHFLRRESTDCVCPPRIPICVCNHVARIKRLTPKPIRPSADEILLNPRSRSARLRAAERLGAASMSRSMADPHGGP